MLFKVGYYDGFAGNSGNVKINELSESLGTPVPEPATLLLLGAGLLGLAVGGRRLRKG